MGLRTVRIEPAHPGLVYLINGFFWCSSFHRNRQSKPVSKGGMAHVTKRHTASAGVNRILPNSGPG